MFPVRRSLVLVLLLALLGSCRSAANLLLEPAPTDPLDGYKGILAEAGIKTEMDWGPRQSLLLSQFTTLTEAHEKLKQACDTLATEKQNLLAQLASEGTALQKEKALRAQAEAETELLRQRRRELEARILSLSIEKAKLEQASLHSKIQALSASLETLNTAPLEAAAPPPRSR